MPTSYPGAIDSLANPTSASYTSNPPHDEQHANANDAIEALETKLGIGTSVPTTSGHVLRATGAGSSAFGAIVDGDIPSAIARDSEVAAAIAAHTHQQGVPFLGPISPAEINSVAIDLAVANRAVIWPFIAYKSATVTTARFRIVTTEAVNLDVGIYSAALARLGSSGSTAVGGSGTTAALSIGSVALVAGTLYYAAFVVGGTTAKFEGFLKAGSAWVTGQAFYQRMETALPLPATFVVAGTDDIHRAVAIYFS